MVHLSEITIVILLAPFLKWFVASYSVNVTRRINGELDVELSPSSTEYQELLCAHVIYRHGDRNIVVQYPNDPYKDPIHWPGGMGQLTNEGKMQHYHLGQFFRRRYYDLLGDKYSPERVFIRSTDYDRTLMSAQANLAGLFPPQHEEEQWHKKIQWQPIPVHTVSVDSDNLLFGGKNCPKYDQLFAKYVEESEEVQRIYADNVELFAYWSRMCGSNVKTIKHVYNLHKTLSIEKLKNKKLPNWAVEAIAPNGTMEKIAFFHHRMAADTPELARFKSGPLIKEILSHFSEKIDETVKSDRLLWFYSGHETTIGDIQNALGIFEPHIPPNASSLHFELYKDEESEHFIQIFYRKSNEILPAPINIPNCGEKCPVNQFYELYKHIIPVDYQSECQLS